MARPKARITTWLGRKKWGLNSDERQDLAAAVAANPWPHSLAGQRAFRHPVPDQLPLEDRQAAMLSVYASTMDDNLTAALREFMPDQLWRLLRSLQVAIQGTPRRRDLRESLTEFLTHADDGVLCWRDYRRVRERVLKMMGERGGRGWDSHDAPTYLGSAPLETERRDAIMNVEATLLDYAAQWVSRWLAQRTLFDNLDRPKQLVDWRREIVALLASGGLGYERIASLATANIWKIPPCPQLKRSHLVKLVKEDLRPGRRRTAARSAATV